MNRPTLESGARSGSVPSGSKRSAREELSALRGHIESSDQIKELTIEAEDECLIRLAQPRRRLDERIEHSLQVEGGAADYLEHVGGGGLLLRRERDRARSGCGRGQPQGWPDQHSGRAHIG